MSLAHIVPILPYAAYQQAHCAVIILHPKRIHFGGQSYKTFYTLGQIYKLVLKLDNMLWLRKYFVRILGHYTLK